ITVDEFVPETRPARQRALRSVALKFTAREDRLGIKSELRLLPRPLHTYEAPDNDTLDRAIFAFNYGDDPQLLMQIEARSNSAAKQWQVAFARLASAELTVQLGDTEVWSAPAIAKEIVTRLDGAYCIVREDK